MRSPRPILLCCVLGLAALAACDRRTPTPVAPSDTAPAPSMSSPSSPGASMPPASSGY
ncbi:MAG: hypothetical protein ABI574_07075 [Burkholderiales bacterium]